MATGYTRQSAAQIAAGNIVTDTGLEAEFDAIVAAMSASGGHNHDGTTGGGALISLTSSVTGILPVANGGTAASTATNARTNLGVAIGSNVQAWSTHLDAISGLSKTDGNIIVANGTTYVAESGATARTSLGTPGLTDNNTFSGLQTYTSASTSSIISINNTGNSSNGLHLTHASGSDLNSILIQNNGGTSRGIKYELGAAGSLINGNGTSGAINISSVFGGNSFAGTGATLIEYFWNSSSPAANDNVVIERFTGKNSAAATVVYGTKEYVIDDASSGSEDGSWVFKTIVAGTLDTDALMIGNGVTVGAPTGGFKGAGTINAVGVYDDNVLLTDYVFDKYFKRTDVEYQDERIQDLSDMFNESALDIDYYSEYWRVNNHLPGMPSQEHYFLDRPSTGQMIQKLWETVEVQAIHIYELNKRLKNIEASKFCECK